MKVSMPKNLKSYTGYEVDAMKKVVANMKEDDASVQDYAEAAVREAIRKENGVILELLKATAEICLNGRASDAYGFGSLTADVWIEATAETTAGFVKIGAYLTDIWSIDGENEVSMWREIYKKEREIIRF